MRICVYGAGVIGSILAAALARAGHDVSVVARGATLQAIRNHGIRIRLPQESYAARVEAASDPGDLGPQDLVIVATKTPTFPDVALGIPPLIGPDTLVAFAANGVFWFYGDGFSPRGRTLDTARLDPDGALHRAVGAGRALGIVCYAGGESFEPGIVEATRAGGRFLVGAAMPAASERTRSLIEGLGVTDVGMEFVPDIRETMWPKLISVISNQATAALTGGTIRQNWGDKEMLEVILALTSEALSVARAHGFTNLPVDIEDKRANPMTSDHKPSMLQDFERGRRIELEAQYLAVQDLARQSGVATPTMDIVVPLLAARARFANCYP